MKLYTFPLRIKEYQILGAIHFRENFRDFDLLSPLVRVYTYYLGRPLGLDVLSLEWPLSQGRENAN